MMSASAAARRRRIVIKKRNLKKGIKRKMPTEMLRAYIGKKVTVVTAGSAMGFEGTLVRLEDNWIMLEGKKTTQIINGDSINYINIKKEV